MRLHTVFASEIALLVHIVTDLRLLVDSTVQSGAAGGIAVRIKLANFAFPAPA